MKPNNHHPQTSPLYRYLPLLCLLLWAAHVPGAQSPTIVAHYINVGQADATFLEFPCGTALIDAGEDNEHAGALTNWLNAFFDQHPKFNRTIDVFFVTHTHPDHNNALKDVVRNYKVKNYVDNGKIEGRGKPNAVWIRKHQNYSDTIEEVTDEKIAEVESGTGLTDGPIDSIKCPACDPVIRVLSGSQTTIPEGWTQTDYSSPNNQSLVIRVDFGQASFLFTGDLEQKGLDTLVDYYDNQVRKPELLRADVYRISHHGSHTGMTESPNTILDAVAPSVAIISVGRWDYGKQIVNGTEKVKSFTTYAYGHPRRQILVDWESKVARTRPTPLTTNVFLKAAKPTKFTVKKAIYATAWDGTINIIATTNGNVSVLQNN